MNAFESWNHCATRSLRHSTRQWLSVYRFWRDLGYAIGALSAGLLAAFVGFAWTIAAIGLLTFISGVVVAALMQEHPR